MKILHSADWHLDAPLQGYEELKETLLTIPGRVAELCQSQGCDLVLLSGDLFDGVYTQRSYRAIFDALSQIKVPVFISPGNHDFISPESAYIREIWPENVHIFKNPAIEKVEKPGFTVYGAGYTSMDCPGLLQGFTAQGEGLKIGIFHGDTTPRSPYCPITKKQVEESGLDYLALGHIHKGDYFVAGATLCAFPGCPMGKDFGETGEKGVYIIDTDDLSVPRFVSLNLSTFSDVTAPVTTTARDAVSSMLPPVGDGNYYRITLTGHSEPVDIPALKERFSQFPHLTLRDQTQPPLDIWKDLGTDSFAGEYFSLLKEALDTATEEDARVLTLAARLSRQILDGEEVVFP
jgi:DNA repair exonuclease SbcCD nuclease subunit